MQEPIIPDEEVHCCLLTLLDVLSHLNPTEASTLAMLAVIRTLAVCWPS